MDDLREEVLALAATLEERDEATLLVQLFDIASQATYVEQSEDDYTPFVYPH
jgi:hypothetical protein